MSRRRYDDGASAGRSKIVPYVQGENPSDRHARRLEANVSVAEGIYKICEASGVTMRIMNGGHHWQFRGKDSNGQPWNVDWWPSSAKLVRNERWERGIHVHDYEQVMRLLRKWGYLPHER